MIISKDPNATAEVGAALTEQSFSIRDQDMHIVLGVLRKKMYSDPIGTICREIACNSRDSHREAGKPNTPIEIILKRAERNSITSIEGESDSISFVDKGMGISPDRMKEIFLNYGASTKRESDNYTGGFGLGSKTPFSYTDQFFVVTISDGIKYHYSLYIDDSERGKMSLLGTEETTEDNGTSIVIPISAYDIRTFENNIIKYTVFWDVQPKLTGFSKVFPTLDIIEANDLFTYMNSNYDLSLADNVILIDGIPYDVPSEYANFQASGTVLLPFKNGILSISSNREALHYDEATIKEIKNRVALIKVKVQTEVDQYMNIDQVALNYARRYWHVFYSRVGENLPKWACDLAPRCVEQESYRRVEINGIKIMEIIQNHNNYNSYFKIWYFIPNPDLAKNPNASVYLMKTGVSLLDINSSTRIMEGQITNSESSRLRIKKLFETITTPVCVIQFQRNKKYVIEDETSIRKKGEDVLAKFELKINNGLLSDIKVKIARVGKPLPNFDIPIEICTFESYYSTSSGRLQYDRTNKELINKIYGKSIDFKKYYYIEVESIRNARTAENENMLCLISKMIDPKIVIFKAHKRFKNIFKKSEINPISEFYKLIEKSFPNITEYYEALLILQKNPIHITTNVDRISPIASKLPSVCLLKIGETDDLVTLFSKYKFPKDNDYLRSLLLFLKVNYADTVKKAKEPVELFDKTKYPMLKYLNLDGLSISSSTDKFNLSSSTEQLIKDITSYIKLINKK